MTSGLCTEKWPCITSQICDAWLPACWLMMQSFGIIHLTMYKPTLEVQSLFVVESIPIQQLKQLEISFAIMCLMQFDNKFY